MSASDETREILGVTDGECPSCGSGSRSEAWYVPGSTGMPVTCTSDWHDEDALEPGAPGVAVLDETRADTGIITATEGHDATLTFPAIPAGDPRPPAITCGDCGETFAQAAFGGRGLFLAETLHAAAVAAGWTEKPEGAWTCTVCLAKAAAPPEPEMPAPVVEPETAPGGDPYDQSIAILDEFNARVPGMWDEVNRSNNATAHKNTLRFGDGYHGFEALFSRTPGLRDDPETAVALLNYEADLAERAEAMHRESEDRLAKLRETDSEEAAA